MSIEAISKVWKTSHQTGTNLLVLLAIADYAEDNGTNAYPSYAKLGKKARLSRRGAMKAIARLKETGEIIVHVEAGAKTRNNRHTNSFDIVFQDGSNWQVVSRRCQVLGTILPIRPKGPYKWGNGERQDTNKKGNGEPGDTIISVLWCTNNGELGDTQNPSMESSIESYESGDAKPKELNPHEQDLLRDFGIYGHNGNPPEPESLEEEVKNSGWHSRSPLAEQALIAFLRACRESGLNLSIPNSDTMRKDWLKSLSDHTKDYDIETLENRYKQAIQKAKEGNWFDRIGRPGSLDKTLPTIGNTVTNGKVIQNEDGSYYL